MATYRLRRFSCPETLKAISPMNLRSFLSAFSDFLSLHGVNIDGSVEEIEVDRLAGIFLDPVPDMPSDLITALVYVDEMATPEAMDSLLSEIASGDHAIEIHSQSSPADIAIQIWMADRTIIERKHAEFCLVRPRSYEYFQSANSRPTTFKLPGKKTIQKLESDLDAWFEQHGRGQGTKVFIFGRDDGIWLLIRHGDTYKREGSLEGNQSSSVHYRPEKYDIVVYQPEIGELRVNAKSKGEKQLYRGLIGKHLFGNDEYFPGTNKFTLEPLRTYGSASLNCIDVEGLEWIKLKEIQILYPGSPWQLISRKSDDVFAVLEARGGVIDDGGRLMRATFQVKFSDCKRPRSVVIRPGNITQLTRDEDSTLVEKWLNSRGFIIHEKANTRRGGSKSLASS